MNNSIYNLYRVLLFGIFILFSCNNTKSELTIPEDKLLKVFFDIYAADHIINEAPKDTRDSLKKLYTTQIFNIHQISKSEFEANLSQLKNAPKKFKKFYDKLDKYGEKLAKDDAIKDVDKNKK